MKDSRQEKVIEGIKNFTNSEIRPSDNDFKDNRGISKELINKLALKGYLATTFPSKYGGLELDPVYYGLLTEEIGKACIATRSLLTVHTSIVGETLLKWGNKNQKGKWLPLMASGNIIGAFALSEPLAGSDAKSIQTSYIEKNDKFIINGAKKWITLGGIADLFIVIAVNTGKITAFLVERNFKGIKTIPIKGLMAGKGTHLSEIKFDNVEVPKENVIGRVGNGFECVVSTALDHGRYSIAWAGVAIAQESLEAMITYSRKRSQFGKKLRSFQLVRGMIADAVTKIHAARALCLRAGELRKSKDPDSIIETTIAKYFTSKVAVKITNDALQVHGANGFTNDYKVERLFREAKVLEIIEGSSQIQQEIIANYGLNRRF
jgi:alkylation response protein AidB-like acyl-CoA dehydrogenase